MKRIRFSIREIFWLMLVIGLVLGWWIDHTVRFRELVKVSEQYREQVAARERDLTVLRWVIEQAVLTTDESPKSRPPEEIVAR